MIDFAKVTLRAGNGGRGVTSFLREKYNPKGGPDGGDGGRGGDIIIRASNQLSTLLDFQYKKVFEAPHGQAGGSRNMHGRDGENLVIEVPTGTVIKVNRIEKEKILRKHNKNEYENLKEYQQIVLNYKKMEKQKRYELLKKTTAEHIAENAMREISVEKHAVEESNPQTVANPQSTDQTYPSWQDDDQHQSILYIPDDKLNESQFEGESSTLVQTAANDQQPQIYLDAPTYDLAREGDQIVIARGGLGGRGNAQFKSASHQTPQESERGQKGDIVEVEIQLKLIANVGLIGFPNAGKSTLLAALTSATPKIGNYPFTTLNPNLGVMKDDQQTVVLADVPGLIEGAHEGKGLGIRFLKHIERTNLLVHMIALPDEILDSPPEAIAEHLKTQYAVIREELTLYKKDLEKKTELLVINKIDLLPEDQKSDYITAIEQMFKSEHLSPIFISAVSNIGLNGLRKLLLDALSHAA